MSTSSPPHVPVLIIGGGIVGLSASLFLAHHSIPTILIERHEGTSIYPRARSVNARTMELYRSINLSSAVREAGASIAASFGIYSGESLKSMIENKPRKEGTRKVPLQGLFEATGPEVGQFVTQDMLEPVLLEAARERGVDARFGTECLGVQQDGAKVTVSLRDRSTEKIYDVTADYLIAADGANSPVRTQLGIQRTGKGSLGNLLNILFHTSPSLSPLVKNREFSLCKINHPEVSGLLTSINNSERWVFHLLYFPDKGEKPADFPPERCAELLHKALGINESEVGIDVKSAMPWQASVRIAEKFHVGRIFLAGDAAHQMPPYAGQGANSGISDVHNLAWKLALVLQKNASPALLDTYEAERLPVGRVAAEASASAADETGLIATEKTFKNALSLVKRLHIMSGFGYTYSSDAVVQESTWPLGGASWRAWSIPSIFLGLDGRPGTRAPHVWIEKAGKKISTLDLFGKNLVLLTGSNGDPWKEAAKQVSRKAGVDIVTYVVGTEGNIVDECRTWEIAAGISSNGASLIRPDGFVAYRERRLPTDAVQKLDGVVDQLSMCSLSK